MLKNRKGIEYEKGPENTSTPRKNIITIGLAFDFHEVYLIPVSKYDQKLDYIVTNKKILK